MDQWRVWINKTERGSKLMQYEVKCTDKKLVVRVGLEPETLCTRPEATVQPTEPQDRNWTLQATSSDVLYTTIRISSS